MAIFDIKPVKLNRKTKNSKKAKFKSPNLGTVSFAPKINNTKIKTQNLIFGFDLPKPQKRMKGKKAMNWFDAKKKYPKLSPFGDADKDGVQNWLDCRPFNKKYQAWDIKSRKKEGLKVSWMSPRTYLRKTKTDPWAKKPEEAEYAKQILKKYYDTETDKGEPIEKLGKHILNPKKKVSIPFIGEEFSFHEGRHRAYAAALAGKKKIPVVVPTPKEWKSEKIVEKFVKKRFPTEGDDKWSEYDQRDKMEKWKQRFSGPFPQDRMDEESIMAYKEVLAEEGIEPPKNFYYHGTTSLFKPSIEKEGIKPSKELPAMNKMSDKTEEEYTYAFKEPHHANVWANLVTKRVGMGKPVVMKVALPKKEKMEQDFEMEFGEAYKYKGKISPKYIEEYEEDVSYPDESKIKIEREEPEVEPEEMEEEMEEIEELEDDEDEDIDTQIEEIESKEK